MLLTGRVARMTTAAMVHRLDRNMPIIADAQHHAGTAADQHADHKYKPNRELQRLVFHEPHDSIYANIAQLRKNKLHAPHDAVASPFIRLLYIPPAVPDISGSIPNRSTI